MVLPYIHISESIRGKPKCLEKELSSSQYSKANSTNSMVYQEIFMACQPRYWNTGQMDLKTDNFLTHFMQQQKRVHWCVAVFVPAKLNKAN